MFKFVKKIFTRPVNECDILVLKSYERVISTLEILKVRMESDENKAKLEVHLDEARSKFSAKLADMVKRGYVHNQFA
jgi:hypothetical protein